MVPLFILIIANINLYFVELKDRIINKTKNKFTNWNKYKIIFDSIELYFYLAVKKRD